MSDQRAEESAGDQHLNDKDTVNALVFLNEDGAEITYDGPFKIVRDGGQFEVVMPLIEDHEKRGVFEATAENLADREGDITLALADGGVEASGRLTHIEILDENAIVAVDDGNRLSPGDVPGGVGQ